MPPRNSLGELELVILMALMRLGDGAYGAAIRAEIRDATHRDVSPGAVYATLARLEARGLLRSYVGDPTGNRGGRARRHFEMRKSGVAEVRRAWSQYSTLALGIKAALAPKGQ
jgi:DNA-binding PadR family transcriptional regulator